MILTHEIVKQLLPVLKLSISKRKFILVNSIPASITTIQIMWKLPDSTKWPALRLNWTIDKNGVSKSGYKSEEEYMPVVKSLCEWLEGLEIKEPEPSVTVVDGYKILFDESPIGSKFDFMQTKGSKFSFPAEFYQNFPCFFTKEEAYSVLTKQMNYMVDQIKLKGHYASLREDTANKLKEMGLI